MLEFLKKNDVNIVADPERGTIQTSELFSTDSLLNLTRNAGANYLLYVTVDRPAASWLKVTFQCYDLSGKALWEEHASSGWRPLGKRGAVEGAQHILGPFGVDCDLRRWGLRLAERGGRSGKKRAIIATARKLAVLLHHLWVSGEVYEPLHNSNQRAMATAA